MTIAVQLAIYSIADRTYQDFHNSDEASALARTAAVVPAVVEAAFQSMDYELLKVSNQLSRLAPSHSEITDDIAAIDGQYANSLEAGQLNLLLADANGDVLYNSVTGAGQVPLARTGDAVADTARLVLARLVLARPPADTAPV